MNKSIQTIQLLVLQSTAFCNINCDYCYLPHRSTKGRMAPEVLQRVADEIIRSDLWAPSSLLLWHAGEPMSLGTDWYRHAHEILDGGTSRLRRIQFQSNGTLLDQDWIDLLRSSGAGLGLSIDGPRELHDTHRRDRMGRGTFDQVMRSVALLRESEIPFTNIATVSADSLSRADEMFDFFSGIAPQRLAFSIEEAEGANQTSSLYREERLLQIESFFHRIAQRNFASRQPMRIREIESVLASLIAQDRLGVSQETELARIVAVGGTGDVAFYSPELLTTQQSDGRYATVGNLLESSFEELLEAEATRRQSVEIARGVDACSSTCSYFRYCGGGSPANKLFETGRLDVSETWYCRIAKQATVRGVLRAVADGRAPASEVAALSS